MEAIEKNNASNTHQEKAKKLRKLRRWQIAVSLLGAAIVVWGIVEVACLFLGYNRTETSNDAQIEQYISPINLRASGYIKKIYFTEHQEVHKGDTLLVLDDREYKIRVMEAEAALKDALAEHGRAVALIGRDAELIGKAIAGCGIPTERCSDMDAAVRWCAAQVQEGDAVLLSPACASFDMFRNYGHRAEVFIAAVRALKGEAA